MAGRIIVSHSAETVGLHLPQWQAQPTATLTPAEVLELIARLEKALKGVKAATAPVVAEADDDPW